MDRSLTMKHLLAKSLLSLATTAGLFAIPTTAQAGDRWNHHDDYFRVDFRTGGRRADDCDTRRVWVEPAYDVREVVRYDHGRRFCGRERVCVRPGHWETVERPVVVPAHERHEERQVLVAPGHYETRCDRVCVREGHWETVAVGHPHPEHDRLSINLGLGGHF